MINFPIAKINLGLNVVSKRPDGYHNLETVFYPVSMVRDALEVTEMHPDFPSPTPCDIKISNIAIDGDEQRNLVVRAYNALAAKYPLPRIHTHLYKGIPTQAGMGGGSSDCAYMITLLNNMFSLNMTTKEMIDIAATLGADCPFFILSQPAYAEGIGERLEPINLDLSNYFIAVVRPDIPVSTKEAFSLITPKPSATCCRDIVKLPVKEWKGKLVNDFETSVFALHPEIAGIKDRLYSLGAHYAAMSGSGSSVFGLFTEPIEVDRHFPGMYTACGKL